MEDINSSAESQNFRDLCMMGGTNLPCPTMTNVNCKILLLCKAKIFVVFLPTACQTWKL